MTKKADNKKKTEITERFSLLIPVEILDRVRGLAKDNDRSVNGQVVNIIKQVINAL